MNPLDDSHPAIRSKSRINSNKKLAEKFFPPAIRRV